MMNINRRWARVPANSRMPASATTVCSASQSANAGVVAVLAAAVILTASGPGLADERPSMLKATTATTSTETVYFGNGCFWGRQKDFVDAEVKLGRNDVSALVGYAAGTSSGPDNKVCYYYADPRTQYERLGHAEVVQVAISTDDSSAREREFREFSRTYFSQFKKTPFGMLRSDPQDQGPGYRNVVGIPGGTGSALFQVLIQENVNNMELRAGSGNTYVNGKPTENDFVNVVWIVDSDARPFYRAEKYHQFHNGIGKAFPAAYTKDLKNSVAQKGMLDSTGCPELPF